MIVGGLVAGQGEISLLALIAIVWVCCVLGDLTAYEIGRRLGRQWLLKHGERLQITEDRLETVEGFLEKRGAVFIVFGRFLGLVRPLIPFTAGASRMPLRRFLPYDVLAAGLWSITFCTLGFLFWRSIDQLTTYVSRGLFAFGTLVVVIGGIVALIHLRRSPEARAKVRDWIDDHDEEPGWKHVAKIARPVWHVLLSPAAKVADMTARFTADRVTPGNLGLELTTLLALGLVGAFSFFLIGDAILNNPNPRIDRMAADLADRLHNETIVDVARVVTDIGSSPVTAILTLATAIFAAVKRRWLDAGALDRRLAAGLRRGPRHQDRLRPRAPGRSVHRHLQRRLSLRPHRLRDRADRDRHRARARGGRLGGADRARDGGRDPRRDRRDHAHLPARALPHRRARRSRAGDRDLGRRGHVRVVRRTRSPQCRKRDDLMSDDEKTYIIIGAAAFVSLVAWLVLVVIPAWKSYWRLRDRIVATVLSVYILAAFVLAGTGVGLAALWYFSDRVEL